MAVGFDLQSKIINQPSKFGRVATAPASRLRTDWLLLAGFCGFLFFFGLSSFGLVGADEPRYAQVAREMLARHDWITPTLGGKPWLEKPPLYYWQAMLSYSIFGVSDWASRLPSAVDAQIVEGFFIAHKTPQRLVLELYPFHEGQLAEERLHVIVPVEIRDDRAEFLEDREVVGVPREVIAGLPYIEEYLFKPSVVLGIGGMLRLYQAYDVVLDDMLLQRRVLEKEVFEDRPGLFEIIPFLCLLDFFPLQEEFIECIEEDDRNVVPYAQRPEPVEPRVFRGMEGVAGHALNEYVPVFVYDDLIIRVVIHHVDLHPLLLVAVDAVFEGDLFEKEFVVRAEFPVLRIESLEGAVIFLVPPVEWLAGV